MSPVLSGWDPVKDRLLSGLTITQQGVKVGPCLVNGKIGQGGMGAVYRARHTMLNLDVAVKILPFHLVEDNQTYVQRFQREAQAAAVVSHQNLVRVFEMGCEKDIYFLILEFVNGESAHARLARKKNLDEGEALRIIRDASIGLSAAHGKNIIHRDVKPDNILVGQDGTVKLADLGLAKISDADFAMTLSNVAMGTPQFMSPEQIKNSKAVTAASDIWAMGVSLYYLLTGLYPFNAENLMGLLNIINDATPSVIKVRSGISEGTQKVINRCLEKKPEDRYKSALDLVAAIDEVLLQLALPSDLTVPEDSCLAAKLGPYTPSLPFGDASQPADAGVSPGSDAPTLIGQGPTSNRPGSQPASDGSFTSTLKLPPRGVTTPSTPGSVGGRPEAPVSTSGQTVAAPPSPETLVTGATTMYQPGSGKSKLLPILIALVITLPLTGYGLYWGLKVKPYNDAVTAAQQFEQAHDFLSAATSWQSAQAYSPTPEATAGFTRNDKLAGLLEQIHQAERGGEWKVVAEQSDAFLKLLPDFAPVKELQTRSKVEIRQAEVLGAIEPEMEKLRKANDWEFRSLAWAFHKNLAAAREEFPDNRVLKRDFAELVLRSPDLNDLDQALKLLDECLATPNLPATEKSELTALRDRAVDSRKYAYTHEKVVDPLDKAAEAAKKRLDEMVANLEDPTAARAAALALIETAIPGLPTDAEDLAKAVENARTKFAKDFVHSAQDLSRTAQRKGQYRIAHDALALVIDQIDDYYKNEAVHGLAFLKLMMQNQALQPQKLGAFQGFQQDGNGTLVPPQNLPVPDLAQIRILRILDRQTVLAVSAGKYYTTTLEFKQWHLITNYPFDQATVNLAPDLRLSAMLYEYKPQDKKPAPPDARTLVVFEQAGESRAWIHTLITGTQPDFHFRHDGTSLLLVAHAADATLDQLYALDTREGLNSWDFYSRGFSRLKTAAVGERIRDPQWLPDGESVVYAVYSAADKTMKVLRLEVKTGAGTELLKRDLPADGKPAFDGSSGEGWVAVDPTGACAAVYDAAAKHILILQTGDGKQIADLVATDTDPAQTGGGLYWSSDGHWLVYKALDGSRPVFKTVGIQRAGLADAPALPTTNP